jgi:transposase InsO family protein
LSAGHIDWYEADGSDIKVCIILDDASRKVLSSINTENSKQVLYQVIDRYWWLHPMRELMMDHGSEFGAHRVHEDGSWNGSFKHLEKHGIRPILGRVAHPQTNWKLKRFFREYKRHRPDFFSIDEFMTWYNNRPHGSLEFERLETPDKAFIRKMPLEAHLQ